MTRHHLVLVLALSLAACGADPEAATSGVPAAEPSVDPAARIERGRYLVTAAGCSDCHTPLVVDERGPHPDETRLLSGHPESMELPSAPSLPPGPWNTTVAASMTAWSGPWGTSFTANLTPDPETGLGRWNEATFIATIRNARHMGAGRPLLPPMPAAGIAQYSDEDLGAIFAYLQSIPAVHNRVPAPIAPPVAVAPAASDERG